MTIRVTLFAGDKVIASLDAPDMEVAFTVVGAHLFPNQYSLDRLLTGRERNHRR